MVIDEGHFEYELDGTCVVARVNDPDISSLMLQDMVNSLQQLQCTHGMRAVVIDLEEVMFLTSECVGVLVSFLNQLKARRGELALGNCSDSVECLLQIAGLSDVLGVVENIPDAIQRLKCA